MRFDHIRRRIAVRGLSGSRLAALIVVAALGYVLMNFDVGWIPFDEGLLAHAAERVLDGELPHRDFDDAYTGGQAFFHAAAFAVLGERLITLRIVLFVALVLTTPFIYRTARRFADPIPSALATVLAVAWSAPVYPASMPSWYNLFLAFGAGWAILRHAEDGAVRWMLMAGACAGISIVFKIVGLYLVAAGLLYAVYREQDLSLRFTPSPDVPDGGGGYRIFVAVCLLIFVGTVLALIGGLPTAPQFLHYVLPPAALVAVLLVREGRGRATVGATARFGRLLSMVGPFLLGAFIPVLVFVLPYIATGSTAELIRGALVLPSLRTEVLAVPPPPTWTVLPLAGLATVLAGVVRRPEFDRRVAWALAIGLGAILVLSGSSTWYQAGWILHVPIVPVVVVIGCWRLALDDERESGRAVIFGLLAAAALLSLVQFPSHFPNYVFYAAPMAVLATTAVVATLERPPRRSLAVVTVFFLIFTVRWIHPSTILQLGTRFVPGPPVERLDLDRGGIRVQSADRDAYVGLVEILEGLPPGPVWATPDSPEVYFLSDRRNPTGTFFDFFESDFFAPDDVRTARILSMLDNSGVQAVVLNRRPVFSTFPPQTLVDSLATRYPIAIEAGLLVVMTTDAGND